MANFNKWIGAGNLTRDPEIKHTASGTAVLNCAMAINREYKDKKETVYVDITFWGKLAEVIHEHAHKGDGLIVEGRLCQDSWEDRETGKKRTKLYITGEGFQFTGSSNGAKPATKRRQAPKKEEPGDDDVPF